MAAPAHAIMLDFEGLQDFEGVGGFYNGGTGSMGSVGREFSIVFGPTAVGLVDLDAGGTGNFANEPSGDTVLAGITPSYYMDVLPGFEEYVSFHYANDGRDLGSVSVYDGYGGTGNLLASTGVLPSTGFGPGDPNGGAFGSWEYVELLFQGEARSVVFSDNGLVAFDNVAIGPIPEPSAAALFVAGFAITAHSIRRRPRR